MNIDQAYSHRGDQESAALQGNGAAYPAPPATPTSTATSAGLTLRQRVVLSMVAQGQPNKRIANELGIAERTVKLHVTALLEKLCARNRTHLVVLARDKGIL